MIWQAFKMRVSQFSCAFTNNSSPELAIKGHDKNMEENNNARVKGKVASQINLFYLALSFFTRIPVPRSMVYSPALLNQASRYFSLVGLFIGVITSVACYFLVMLFPLAIAILLTMILSLFLTGAFHEDGLADMADGIGGGFTIEKRLAIMKDSRLGTYGTITLFMALLNMV